MSRIGAIVKRLYGEDVKSSTNVNKAGAGMNERPNRNKNKLTAFKKALGSRKTAIWAIRIAVAVVVLFIAAESVFQFNRFAAWQTKVTARRADVDREYQRRKNLIPNLVLAASNYLSYEKGVVKDVSEARKALSMIRSSATSGGMLQQALSKLVALAEAYPDLKATQSVQDLIKEAANTEDRIADAKKEYNKDCEVYNQYLSIFPGNVFAFFYRYERLPYMGLEDVNVPVIDLEIVGLRKRIEENAEVNIDAEDITKQKTKKQKDSEIILEKLEKT